ncbi:MAG: glutamine synthetase family protein [Hyphomicrobiaceae bacterium]
MNDATADPSTLNFDGGILAADKFGRAREVLREVTANGLETIRLSFADQHGLLRGKTIVANGLATAFRNGITAPSTILLKDPSHHTAFPVWAADAGFGRGILTGAGDVCLVPDPDTFRTLPWSPRSGWLLCDVVTSERSPIEFASRNVLRNARNALAAAGYDMVVGLEIEFHVFKLEDSRLTHGDAGMPGAVPETSNLTRNYELLGESRYDALESVMDAIRQACAALRLPVKSMEAEFGPSQIEFVFEPGGVCEQADAMVLFRSAVKQVCARLGLHATFMCRPVVANGACSGWHIHQSLVDRQSGHNVFMPGDGEALNAVANNWIAGLLEHAAECCLMTTPTVNGYRRYQPHQLAPDRIQWGNDNKGAMIRGLMRPGDHASRIENRVAEPAANPHYALASQIYAGLSGLTRNLAAPAPVERPYDDDAAQLPDSLLDAIEAFEAGDLFRQSIGPEFVAYYGQLKRAEWLRYISTLSEWEQKEYFAAF